MSHTAEFSNSCTISTRSCSICYDVQIFLPSWAVATLSYYSCMRITCRSPGCVNITKNKSFTSIAHVFSIIMTCRATLCSACVTYFQRPRAFLPVLTPAALLPTRSSTSLLSRKWLLQNCDTLRAAPFTLAAAFCCPLCARPQPRVHGVNIPAGRSHALSDLRGTRNNSQPWRCWPVVQRQTHAPSLTASGTAS